MLKKSFMAVLILSPFCTFAAKDSKADLKSRMNQISQKLAETVPFLYPDKEHGDEGFKKKLKELNDTVSKLDAKAGHGAASTDADPALPYIAGLFRQEIKRAYESSLEGHIDYARQTVRDSVSYCIACHTRNGSGNSFPLLDAFAKPMKDAKWVKKIEFQAATRQFETATGEVMAKLNEPGLIGISPLELETAIRIALAIAVRVNNDPVRADVIARAAIKSPSATPSIKRAAEAWLKDIGKWRDDKKIEAKQDLDLIRAARALIKPTDDESIGSFAEGDIRFLRATVLVQDLLRRFPQSPYVAESYYIAGISYDSLGDLGLWSLEDIYLLACVEKAPHTPQAMQCYRRYKESVTLGYTGSSGVHLPKSVIQHLKRVEAQAK